MGGWIRLGAAPKIVMPFQAGNTVVDSSANNAAEDLQFAAAIRATSSADIRVVQESHFPSGITVTSTSTIPAIYIGYRLFPMIDAQWVRIRTETSWDDGRHSQMVYSWRLNVSVYGWGVTTVKASDPPPTATPAIDALFSRP